MPCVPTPLVVVDELPRELKPGTRIVSHAFDIEGWEPERVVESHGR